MKLVIVDGRRFALSRRRTIVAIVVGKVIVGVSNSVVIDPGCSPVPSICATLHIQQNGSAPLDPEFGRGRFLDAQFLNSVWREGDRGNS